jgi:hypothetical protein
MADRRDRFEDVLGNETALRLLGRALETGEVSQAYLFHGPPGVGKRMVALRFGAALVAGGDGDSAPGGVHDHRAGEGDSASGGEPAFRGRAPGIHPEG